MDIILLSFLAGIATFIGATVILAFGKPSAKTLAVFLGLAAGIMLGVVALDLIPSAFKEGGLANTIIGIFLGIIILAMVSKIINSFFKLEDINPKNNKAYLKKMGYLIAIGIALHDLPEGIAIAAGFSAHTNLGWIIAVAIGLHNVPEGIAIAAPLLMGGTSPVSIMLITLLVSVFTPLGTALGLLLVNISGLFISILLALAAGAMLYIVFKEIIPEARSHYPKNAFLGSFLGLLIIVILGFF